MDVLRGLNQTTIAEFNAGEVEATLRLMADTEHKDDKYLLQEHAFIMNHRGDRMKPYYARSGTAMLEL